MKTQKLSDLEALLLLAQRVATDTVSVADVAYVVGQTAANAPSVLLRASMLYHDGVVSRIAIQRGGEGFGYFGFNNSRQILFANNVPWDNIVPMDIQPRFEAAKQVNTLTEMISLVTFVQSYKWKSLILVAPHFHQLRVLFSAVTALDQAYPELRVVSCAGVPLMWDEEVAHSQGTTFGTRSEIFVGEVKRILSYQQGGKPFPLVTAHRALEYIEQRDRR